jgi:hypothetical protein
VPDVDYHAPKTVSQLMLDDTFVRLIAGPLGSGKTTGLIFELLRRSLMQTPAADGYRYTRWAILRQTLQQLKQTVLKDISHWFSGIARWKVSENTIYFHFGDVRSEWILLPLEEPEDRRRVLSMNLTGAMLSECIEIDYELVNDVAGRCGRFPLPTDGGCTWNGIVMDTNMPPEGTPWHAAMIAPPPDWKVYIQPGGLDPDAENLEWLLQTSETLKMSADNPARLAQGRTYYERLARGNNENWIKRYVHAQFGPDPSGTAVYAGSFRHSFHAVDNLEVVPNTPLYIGQDFGRDPWSVFMQVDWRGRLLVLEEVKAVDIGLITHIRNNLRPALMNPRYQGLSVVVIGDPAGVAKSQYDELNAFDIFKREGIPAVPAGTNDFATRMRDVEYYLLQQRDGGPAMIFDKTRAPVTVQGMGGMYRFGKTQLDVSKPLPDKNPWSHPCEAVQYGAMGTRGNTARAIARVLRPRAGARRPATNAAGWT